MSTKLISVVTTIQPPTACMRKLASTLKSVGAELIVVGDEQGPTNYEVEHAALVSLEDQLQSGFRIAELLPTGHYVRKNLGYLLAIRRGAQCIYETDDDNAPMSSWSPRTQQAVARRVHVDGWLNVYRLFSDETIWPRGFPLDKVRDSNAPDYFDAKSVTIAAPVQQSLANGSPDVDAVWRLTADRDVRFQSSGSVWLAPGTWCPFNSQSTWWWPFAYPLMYLPACCSLRMTDIWRSFIAQRCLWAAGFGLVFHGPEVEQDRNFHFLMRDFEDEIAGYLRNAEFARLLGELDLNPAFEAVGENILLCYDRLIAAGFFSEKETQLVQTWLADVEACQANAVEATR